VTFKFTLEGFRGAAADLKRLDARITKAVRPVVRRHAAKLERDIKAAAPVDKGDLRGSIQARVASDGQTAIVYSDDETARLTEFGGLRQDPQPFFLPTAAKTSPAFRRAIEKALKKALK
jgi:HK97 gp10 family phage protein